MFIINKNKLNVLNKQHYEKYHAANTSIKSFKSSNNWFEFCIIGITTNHLTRVVFGFFTKWEAILETEKISYILHFAF